MLQCGNCLPGERTGDAVREGVSLALFVWLLSWAISENRWFPSRRRAWRNRINCARGSCGVFTSCGVSNDRVSFSRRPLSANNFLVFADSVAEEHHAMKSNPVDFLMLGTIGKQCLAICISLPDEKRAVALCTAQLRLTFRSYREPQWVHSFNPRSAFTMYCFVI